MAKRILRMMLRCILGAGLAACLLLAGPAYIYVMGGPTATSWATASRMSAGLAPLPENEEDAVVQVYAARTFGWRGAFAVHTWVATKRPGADSYRTHHVIGWYGGSKVVSQEDIPDRYWYGAKPDLVLDMRGGRTATVIDEIERAVKTYPYPDSYRAWPGPNSNTFVAWIGRSVPGLELEMPPLAVGKDYLGISNLAAMSPSRTGVQINFAGVLGATLAIREGLELNVLGLSLGIDPIDANLKLPGVGSIGPAPDPGRP